MMTVENPENLPSVQVNEFLPAISPWTTLGGLTLFTIFWGAIALMSVIRYPVTVQAPATIRPNGELRLVQAATDGRITKLLVQENQPVRAGEVLARLDDSSLQTQKSHLQAQIQAAKVQLTQIQTQIQFLDSEREAEVLRTDRSIASAQAELSRHQRQYRDNQLNATATVQEAQANLKAAQNDWQKAQLDLTATEANLKSIQAALNTAKARRDRCQFVAQEGAFPQDQLDEAQLAVQQQQQAHLAQLATIEAQKKMGESHQQAIQSAMARLERAKVALNPSQAEVVIASEQIAKEGAIGKVTLATLKQKREDLMQQKIKLQLQLTSDQRSLQQVTQDLTQTAITAIASGIIVHLNLRNLGQTVHAGETLAHIVPTQVPWVIKAAVSPQYIGKLSPGQTAQIRISACPYSDYGTLKGMVKQISQDTIRREEESSSTTNIRPNSFPQASAFYEITIQPERLFVGNKPHLCSIQLGMEGRADIMTKEETVLQFLLRKIKLMGNN